MKLMVVQAKRNQEIPTYAESPQVREEFEIVKSAEIGKHSPDLVYCQAYWPVMKELLAWDGPMVIHLGGNPWLEFGGKRLQKVTELLNRATLVTCVSKFLAGEVVKGLGRDDNVMALPGGLWGTDHTPIGIQPNRFKPKENYEFTWEEHPTAIMGINLRDNAVTRNKWIGIPKFLQAVNKVARRYGGVDFACCGRVDEGFPHIAAWNRLYNFRVVPSHQLDNDEDKWPLMLRDADLYVHPGHYDCWPRCLADAMCAGLPCLVCDTTGNREVGPVELYRKGKPGSAATLLDMFLQDKRIRMREGMAARKYAVEQTKKWRHQFVEAFKEALKCAL